jgi:hypothetical protein
MSTPITITITVSGPNGIGTLTIAQTIWNALNEACLDVQWPQGGPHVSITTLFEQQAKLAMANTRCTIQSEVNLAMSPHPELKVPSSAHDKRPLRPFES